MKAALLAAILFAAISMAYGCNMTITHIGNLTFLPFSSYFF